MASIPACHAGDRGSIPRRGDLYLDSSSFLTGNGGNNVLMVMDHQALIAQLGERQTEDLKVAGSNPA